MDDSVSVVIPVYNGERHLADCLKSVLAQTRAPAEVIVVDDGSTDGSAAVVEVFPDVLYVRQDNAGPGAARNAGSDRTNGDYLAFIDQDDTWTEDKLAVQLPVLRESPRDQVLFAHSIWYLEDDTERPAWLKPELLERPLPSILPSTMLIHRDLLRRVGNFNCEFQTSSDVDFALRCRDAGIRLNVLPEVLLHRRIHRENQSKLVQRIHREMLDTVALSLKRRRAANGV